MPTRDQVLALLDRGHTFQTAGRELGIAPGQAFMLATGRPADGGEAASAPVPRDAGVEHGSPQQLVNPASLNPTRDAAVIDWVRARAARQRR